jgi:hypothetical protein
VTRATAESDLNHLAATCHETLQASLPEVVAEVEALEREGGAVPDARAIAEVGQEEGTDEGGEPLGPTP